MSDDDTMPPRRRLPLDRLIEAGAVVSPMVRPHVEAELGAIIREYVDAHHESYRKLVEDLKADMQVELRSIRREAEAQSKRIHEQSAKLLQLAGLNANLKDEIAELKDRFPSKTPEG